MKAKLFVILGALVIVGGGAGLFAVQNSSRTTQLSFDIGLSGWELAQPVPIPMLMGLCLVSGVAIGVLWMGGRVVRLSSQVRRLERQSALSDTGTSDWPT